MSVLGGCAYVGPGPGPGRRHAVGGRRRPVPDVVPPTAPFVPGERGPKHKVLSLGTDPSKQTGLSDLRRSAPLDELRALSPPVSSLSLCAKGSTDYLFGRRFGATRPSWRETDTRMSAG